MVIQHRNQSRMRYSRIIRNREGSRAGGQTQEDDQGTNAEPKNSQIQAGVNAGGILEQSGKPSSNRKQVSQQAQGTQEADDNPATSMHQQQA